jgi:hypothetical protein
MWCQRWLKILLRIDPLVGMYFASGTGIGRILARVQDGKYLAIWFWERGETLENRCVMELCYYPAMRFFYIRKEAERWRDWQRTLPKPAEWKPPQPVREFPLDVG